MDRGRDGLGVLAGFLALLLLLAVLAVVVVAVVLLWRRFGPAAPGGLVGGRLSTSATSWGRPVAAEQILAERLARGEMEVADFEERLAALRRSMQPDAPPPGGPPAGSPPPDAGPVT
jgi:putative membrane protein